MLSDIFDDNMKVVIQKGDLARIVDYCLIKYAETTEQYPPHLTIKQLSRYLNYSEAAIYKMASSKEIPFYKLSGKLLFKRAEVDEWLFQFHQPTIKTRMSLLDNDEK